MAVNIFIITINFIILYKLNSQFKKCYLDLYDCTFTDVCLYNIDTYKNSLY